MQSQAQKPLKILVIDNTREPNSFGSSNIAHWAVKAAPPGSEVLVRRAPDLDLPLNDFKIDALVVSGSITSCLETEEPWIRPLDEFLKIHLQRNTPMLGICYGHQALARCLFEIAGQKPQLQKSQQPELGWQTIEWLPPSRLFDGLKPKFVSYESHYEEVASAPPGTRVVARSERCEIQAIEVEGKDAFGVQFHPEYSIQEAELSLANKLKKGERKDWILKPGQGPKLYDDQVGNTIFGNFFNIATQRKA